MGNDGGVVAVKRKFMRGAGQKEGRKEKQDQDLAREQQVSSCAISQEPLQEPIVACELGNLYNKEVLIEHLVAKTIPDKFKHITSLKDVVTCHFYKGSEQDTSKFYCPVTMLAFNGKYPFVVVSSCGCVVSERCMKEVKTEECLSCGKLMANGHLIHLFQTKEQYDMNQQRLLKEKAEAKQERKGKKKHSKKRKSNEKEVKKSGGVKKSRKECNAGNDIIADAAVAISRGKEKSQVYKSLFSSDKDEKKSANDLLMTVGGMRYNLS